MNKVIGELKDKKILVLGYGREGKSTLNFLKKWVPTATLGIADKDKLDVSDKRLSTHFGANYLKSIFDYDVIFKTPGLPNKTGEIKEAKRRGIVITSQTKLFFDICGGTIIGVTGTKGKSTTTTLIYEMLKKGGKDAVLLGNIGKPCLDYLDTDFGRGKFFAFEMSSHQLADLHKSPHIAVFLNIFKEHLDYYESFEKYLYSKAKITLNQSRDNIFVYNSDFKELSEIASKTKARRLSFSLKGRAECYMEGSQIFLGVGPKPEKIIDLAGIPLKGEHNLNNVMAASLAAYAVDIPIEKIRDAIKNFRPLEHRLEEVGSYKGITFVDDSLATVPEATIAAMKAYSGRIGSIILGGSDRGQDFKDLANEVLSQRIATVILFPTTGEKIWRQIEASTVGNPPKHFFVDNMEEAVRLCFENTPEGTICLMSTASPSFSVFKNYEEKSKAFRKYIMQFGPIS